MNRFLGSNRRIMAFMLLVMLILILGIACTGDQGLIGSQGAPGPQGSVGAVGPTGPAGPVGPAGQATSVSNIGAAAQISAEMPYETQFIEVKGSRMAYVEAGQGDPILFIHGNPTSKYLWRNIMPLLEGQGRVIALDLIGMGESDKPEIGYTFAEHSEYLDGFIDALELEDITLVIHDWGSALGLNYAMNNEENIKRIAMMEALLIPIETKDLSEERRNRFQNRVATMDAFRESAITDNAIVESIANRVIREMTETEMDVYREPFQTEESRELTFVWVSQIPVDGKPENVHNIVTSYNKWLQETEIPKLLLYVSPGAIVTPEVLEWSKANMKNLEVVDLGEGLHFLQEDHPEGIGRNISDWYRRIS